ncbi:2-polyprenyl-3-methyl-5-hydroxy-6-metoxy-1,4-benzoquinol methylase [Desulfohalotomaculum tongense]|uniref:class I SAM-dependent methyltransferase n=1 Tax=Desulforadius tongensis TaxID=1216062 RepID=UPI00195C992F|nr:class I SAM-dependent methyltransferase [Desulforadius tongensis]MBM7853713.1 2-polyprenyl-3-methyl-5-hydroxy-6-metoxy-1,4-benzoquinol methylase [Desulforadius tongensis]
MDILERIDPKEHRNDLMYPEHLGRYVFAAQLVKNKKILDAACGNGYGTHYLADQGSAEKVWGVDISPEAIKYCRQNYSLKNVEFIEGDVCDLSFLPDHTVDIVVSFETIEHLPNEQIFIEEIARVLKLDGLLIISCPNDFVFNPDNPYHLQKFTLEEFHEILKSRFKKVKLYSQNNILGTSIITYNELTRQAGSSLPGQGYILGVDEKKMADCDTWLAVCSNYELPNIKPCTAFLNTYSQYVKEINQRNKDLEKINRELYEENKKLLEENKRLADAWTQHVHTINVHTEYIKRIEEENKRFKELLNKYGIRE